MENKLNLYQRILAIMSELSYIQKGDKRVQNQYNYVSHDQVTAAVHPLLVKHGVLAVPTTKHMKQEGNRTEVQLDIYFINADNPKEQIGVTSYGYGVDQSDKGPGKAVSYAYKYALLKLLALETGDDPDHDQKTTFKAPACLDFDYAVAECLRPELLSRMPDFLKECAESMNKDTEDVKREAMTRLPGFIKAFEKWETKKK